MKLIAFPKTLRTLGLSTLMTIIVGANIQQTAQAQFFSTGDDYMPCSEANFSDPDSAFGPIGSLEFLESLKQRGQFEEYEQATKSVFDEMAAINASINVFAVDLDAPIGYVANKTNGVDIKIPPAIEQSMREEMAYPYSREKVKTLNEKYGQYAIFGQQITLVYSPAQLLQAHENLRKYNAIASSFLTPEEKQAARNLLSSQGYCAVVDGRIDMGIGTMVIEVGQRPDLDARLREDTTGTTFFR